MKYLGIDFGTKYIGLAISDDGGTMAFPREVIGNDDQTLNVIDTLIAEEGIEAIVMSHSLNQAGGENPVAQKAKKFAENFSVPVHWQDERFSSLEATRHIFHTKPVANPRRSGKSIEREDASAATLILQRFLDKQ